MDISQLARAYAALPPADQAMFAAMVRAHQSFNAPEWQTDIAQRHQAIEAGGGSAFHEIEDLLQAVNARAQSRSRA